MKMGEIDHTHPHTGEPFGKEYYAEAVAADGGKAGETMADVDHKPPTEGTKRAFERGSEGREKTV